MTRTILTGSATYYIDLYNGNDNNDGSVGSPWLTMQHAHDWCQNNLDLAGNQLTWQIAPTTSSAVVPPLEASGSFVGQAALAPVFSGDASNPWNVVVHMSGTCVLAQYGAILGLNGLTFQSDTGDAVQSEWPGTQIQLGNNFFFGCPNGYHMHAIKGGYIFSNGSYQIWGSASAHACADAGTVFISGGNGGTWEIYGTPVFSQGFVYAVERGEIASHTMSLAAGSGNCGAGTPRYSANWQSMVASSGGGPDYFPGTSPGSVDATSIYL